MSSTRKLAGYVSKLNYEDLPPEVVEKGKLAVLDTLGNCIGGYPLGLARTFLDMTKDLGGGRAEASLIGDGTKVSVPMAAFGNGALSTMLDYCDSQSTESGRRSSWVGALTFPAALAAGESRGISGRELLTSVVAGYECAARILHSMDVNSDDSNGVTGETMSVFGPAAGAGRALGLSEDEMLSTLCMAGIYTPVAAGFKWLGDDGLLPRKDIKQGWAWMCMTGTFAAVSAQKGLKALQENSILEGDKGLWRMLGMDTFNEEVITAGLGEKYHILQFRSKLDPGCAVTHTGIEAAIGLVKDHNINPGDIESVHVITNRSGGIGFHDQEPRGLCDREFSIPYQMSAAILAGDRGPRWYTEATASSPQMADMTKRVTLSFDDESEQVYLDTGNRMSKMTITTRAGQRYSTRVDQPPRAYEAKEVRNKFLTTTRQVIDQDHIDKIMDAVDNLETVGKVSQLVDLLRIPSPKI